MRLCSYFIMSSALFATLTISHDSVLLLPTNLTQFCPFLAPGVGCCQCCPAQGTFLSSPKIVGSEKSKLSLKSKPTLTMSRLLLFQNIAAFQTSVATSNIESTIAHSDSRCHQYLLGVLSGEAWCLMLRLRIGTFSQTPRDPAPFVLFLLPLCLWPE